MKTDDLVSMLATGALPVPRQAATRRLVSAFIAVYFPFIQWIIFEFQYSAKNGNGQRECENFLSNTRNCLTGF